MRLLVFELGGDAGLTNSKTEAWKSRLRSLCPSLELFESSDIHWARRAAWRGEPFVIAAPPWSLDAYLDSLDEHTTAVLADCAYFWVLTDSGQYWHRRIAEDRIVVLTWNAAEQNVIRDRLELLESLPRLKGLSRRMHYLRQEIHRIASGPTSPGYSVLLLGASGVGKEEVAQSLFEISDRASIPRKERGGIHPVGGAWLNMEPGMALTELIGLADYRTQRGVKFDGIVQLFARGALFIDDFESAPRNVQETLLRIMSTPRGKPALYTRVGGNESEETDVWLIFATNSAVDKLLRDQRLREDFLYRFEDRVIMIPPLKARPADFPAVARAMWHQLWEPAKRDPVPLTSDVLKHLFAKSLDWEGNVRALRAFLALLASMKTNPAHNQNSLGMLIDRITQRGRTYKEWIGILETDFFRGGRALEDQIRTADTGHIRCFGPSSPNDPDETNLTPSEQQARAVLTSEGWETFKGLVSAARKTKSSSVIRASVRMSRIIWYVSQSHAINWAVAGGLSHVSPNIGKQDLSVLANGSGPALLAKANTNGQDRNAPERYTRVAQFFR